MERNKPEFISKNKDGNYYIGFRVPVKRGIKGKTKAVVDELIIIGIHKDKMKDFCKEHGIKEELWNSL